jgi:galactose mutarotase-like enzyme
MKGFHFLSLTLIPALIIFCNQNGCEVYLFTLTNKAGNILKLTNYGAKILKIEVPDKKNSIQGPFTVKK